MNGIQEEQAPAGTAFHRMKTELTHIEDGTNLLRDGGCNAVLSGLATKHALEKYIVHQGHLSQTVLASTIEAIIGAVWIDSGKDLAQVKHVVGVLLRRAS